MKDVNREVSPAQSRETVLNSQYHEEGVSRIHAGSSAPKSVNVTKPSVSPSVETALSRSQLINQDASVGEDIDGRWREIIARQTQLSRKELIQKYSRQIGAVFKANQSNPHQSRQEFNQLKKAFQILMLRF
ncbi:MAG: hypothetical protein OXF85_00285 [Candidatus Saccharibacteria bacterium]|nr:hypothetical protein [Candidatus Saccharibacteria bacterium]MCY4010808.1 hypothetical protein [Candidatus Saccharibacteria bacterium]MCY4088961.1 hypothetical protein [Candidatus Saccharibacteria bacterium]